MSPPELQAVEPDEATRRGLALYESTLKTLLEPEFNGQVVAIHPDSEDYVVAATSGEAMRVMYARRPEGQVLLHVIGPVPAASGLAVRMLGTHTPWRGPREPRPRPRPLPPRPAHAAG